MAISRFGQTLGVLIERHHSSAREFARTCGLASATVSRLITGERGCSRDSLRVICENISPQILDRYELLIAHLIDEAAASGLDVSRLLIRHISGVNLSELDLTPEMNGQLGVIARAATEFPEVAEQISGLSELITRYRAHSADYRRVEPALELLVAEDPAPYGAKSTTAEPSPTAGKVLVPHPVEAAMEKEKARRRAGAVPKPHKT